MSFLSDLIFLLYWLRGLLLEQYGCRVFEDLSAICDWATYSVPW